VAARARTILFWFVVAFFVYAVFRSPDQAAGLVGGALDGLAGGVAAIGDFFDALLARS
jgi:hypothetical protein